MAGDALERLHDRLAALGAFADHMPYKAVDLIGSHQSPRLLRGLETDHVAHSALMAGHRMLPRLP